MITERNLFLILNSFLITTHGDNTNPTGPWASLAGARDALRKLRAAGDLSGPVRVEIAEGTYRVTERVCFHDEDGDTTYVAAEGASPVFDGGRVLNGWEETEHRGQRAWVLDLPEVASGYLFFRSLYVHGNRRPRARLPKFTPDAVGVENVRTISAIRFPERRKLFDGDYVFKPAEGDFQAWPSLPDAEVVLLHYWVETRLPDPIYDPATGWVRFSRRSVFNLYESFNPKLARYYIDNLYEALSEPGEWYLDRTSGRLTYLPMPDEELESTSVVAPLVTALIGVIGQAYNHGGAVNDILGSKPVERLIFSGLTFRHTDWFQPGSPILHHHSDEEVGLREVPMGGVAQASYNLSAVMTFKWARHCRVEHCTVEHVGFSALEFGLGCRDCEASHNTFQHLGGGGAKIGGAELNEAPDDRTGRIRLADNTIRHVGRIFHQSVGILLTHAYDCDLIHNEIAHTCYTGISCGWAWGYHDTITRNIRIENNLIHNICEGVLSDNGAIYLLGVQPGTLVCGNHIHHVSAADYGGWGIYPDEGTSHVVFEHNWIHDTQATAFNINWNRDLVVRNNVFARCGDKLIGVGKAERHKAATILHNVLIGPCPAPYGGGPAGDLRDALCTDANLIWLDDSGKVPPCIHPDYRTDVPLTISWEDWKKCGHDCNSIIADPLVTETPTSITFAQDSPALKMGFQPFDWSICGPRK